MRKLVWFTVGFAAACAVCAYFPVGIFAWIPAILFASLGILLWILKKDYLRVPLVLAIGCTLGFLWYFGFEALYITPIREFDGQTLETQVEITQYSGESAYGVSTEGKINLQGKDYKIWIYSEDHQSLKPGDTVYGELRLRLTTLGASEDPTYHQGDGIWLLGSFQEGTTVTQVAEIPGEYWAQQLRQGILERLDALFPADTVAFARALLLGDTGKLSYKEDTDFQVSGIRHIVAVSGLHVSILFALVYMLALRKRLMTALLGIPVLIAFAAIAGFSPSIIRACVMQGLVILALLLNKEYDPPTALAAAVTLLLALNPLSITSVSFQLSVGCMVGIFLFSKKIHDYMLRGKLGSWAKKKGIVGVITRWCIGSVSVTLGSMSLTTPLCAAYFGLVSVIGVLTNIVILWVVSLIFYGIMLVCVLGSVWWSAGAFAAAVISWPIRLVQWVAGVFAGFPFAAVYTDSNYLIAWLIFTYVLIALFLLLKKKHPWVFSSCIAVSLAICVAASWLEPVVGNYYATVIDVGQGQCVLLQGKGKRYLVDCGGGSGVRSADAAIKLLMSRGIFRLDGVIVTHFDEDHVNGVANLLSRIPADTLYLPDAADEEGYRETLVAAYESKIQWVQETTVLESEDALLTIFPGVPGETGNESSLCILFQRENCDILITGDRSHKGERDLLEQGAIPGLELLVAGHHGADSSTGLALLQATRPAAVAISVGKDNYYGHPNDSVLDLLELFDCRVYRTDLSGTIDFRGRTYGKKGTENPDIFHPGAKSVYPGTEL